MCPKFNCSAKGLDIGLALLPIMDALGVVVVVVVGNVVAAFGMVVLEGSRKSSPRTSDAYLRIGQNLKKLRKK